MLIFFVISGYLITSIFVTEQNQNTFGLKGFYARRARRILPALLLVTLSCMFIAPVFLTPLEMQRFAYTVTSVLTFRANFFLARNRKLLMTTSELKTLLHTWSLAVEEQFYIFFPLLMLLFAKTRKPTSRVESCINGRQSLHLHCRDTDFSLRFILFITHACLGVWRWCPRRFNRSLVYEINPNQRNRQLYRFGSHRLCHSYV